MERDGEKRDPGNKVALGPLYELCSMISGGNSYVSKYICLKVYLFSYFIAISEKFTYIIVFPVTFPAV